MIAYVKSAAPEWTVRGDCGGESWMTHTLTPDNLLEIAEAEARRFGRTDDLRDEYTGVASLALCEKESVIERARNPGAAARIIARNAIIDELRRDRPTQLGEWVAAKDTTGRDPQSWLPDVLDKRARLAEASPAQLRAARSLVLDDDVRVRDRKALSRLRAA